MFDLTILERLFIIVIVISIGFVLSLVTTIELIPFSVGVISYQIIDAIISYFRFKK